MRTFFTLMFIALTYSCNSVDNGIKTNLEGQPLPSIDLLMIDSITHFNINSISNKKPTILLYFEPWCPYCRAQTKSIISQIKSLKEINIYMLCTCQYSEFNSFYKKYELSKYSNIKAGIDYNYGFIKYFKNNSVPYIAIYNREKKLKKIFVGKSYIATIKKIALN